MSSDWINKAKEAAKQAAVDAKKLAESAKNANYGEMLDKTKNMAMRAADEAKKAAGSVMNKEQSATEHGTTEQPVVENDAAVTPAPSTISTPTDQSAVIIAKLDQVQRLLNEIKLMLPSK